MARITIIGAEGRQDVALAAHNTLGRHPNNTIQLLDRIVSKEHCHISLIDGQYVLKDLGSLNGTYVNGERVQGERLLRGGDEISLGATRITFQAGSGASAPPPPLSSPGRPLPPPQITAAAPPSPAAPIAIPSAMTAPALSRVTIAPGMVESHIRTKIAQIADQSFLPEKAISDVEALRRDYEKLRVGYELAKHVGFDPDIERLLRKILDAAFQILPADRGVILLVEGDSLQPKCVRTRRGGPQEEVVLSTTILETVRRDKAGVLSSDASMDSRFSAAHSIIMQGIRSTMAVPLLYSGELLGVMILDSQVATNAFTEKDLQLFQNVANQAAVAIQNSLYAQKLEKEAVTRERFQRLLSPAIAEQVIAGKVEVAKGGQLRDTTVLFSDIRGFTPMSEKMRAPDVVDLLNEYFEVMVEIVFRHEGTLDKFVGDEIMALFGAPVSHPDDPQRAVRTALEMMSSLADLNRRREARGEKAFEIGIGINCGEVVAGYLGSSRALEYTVIGDVVNTGARLCSSAKAGEIVISEHVFARISEEFECAELPAAALKGKSQSLRLYKVVGAKSGARVALDRTIPTR